MHRVGSGLHYLRESLLPSLRKINISDLAILVIGLGLAIAVRLPLLDFKSSDFFNSLETLVRDYS